jgi:hypothetical protein
MSDELVYILMCMRRGREKEEGGRGGRMICTMLIIGT